MPLTEVQKRRQVERRIIRRLLQDGIKAGYTVSLYDGQEYVVRNSTSVPAILKEMFSVDEESLVFHKDGKRGIVYLVYGNGGWDVIADYSTSLEPIMEGATEVSDKAQ